MNCSGCKFPIKKDVHTALGLKWHRNCFRFVQIWCYLCCLKLSFFNLWFYFLFIHVIDSCRCSECLSTIPVYYMPRDNVLYCKKDYILKFGEHCQRCTKQITGPVMVSCHIHILIWPQSQAITQWLDSLRFYISVVSCMRFGNLSWKKSRYLRDFSINAGPTLVLKCLLAEI